MKHLLLAIFLLIFTANLSAQNYKGVDTVVYESWTNNAWQVSNRTIFTYNEGCQQVSSLNQTWNGSSWINTYLSTVTYTSGDHLSQVLGQQWNSTLNGWDNSSKTTFTYNGSFKVLTRVTQIWVGGAWTNQGLYAFTYNADGTVNQEVIQIWNQGSMSWVNYYRTSYTYNADKTDHQSVSEQWDGVSNWVNSARRTFTHDAQGRLLTILFEKWQTNAWVNNTLYTISYNGSGQLTNYLVQTWNISSNAWTTTQRSDNTYYGNGSLFQLVTQVANEGTNYALVNFSRETYHYSTECILPLTLLDFTVTLSGKDVLLKWTTTKEVNTSYFDVQSSKNADRFEKIGSVKAAANSTQKINYQFVDANPTALVSGKIYYRLKMVDRDGKFSYSKIAFVGLPHGENLFTIFPNAVKDNLFVLYNAQNTSQKEVRIIDQSGRQVYRQQVKPGQAGSQLSINVSRLHAGSYYLELVTNEGIRTSKFIKL